MPRADMGRRARGWAYRAGLHRSRIFVWVYGRASALQYEGSWDDEVPFRGHLFQIGEDRSLYPAVRRGWFEAAELDALLIRVRDGDTVWDVGANVGIYSVLLAGAVGTGRVVAFEPVPDTRRRLASNLARNGVTNVVVEDVALSSTAGTAHMVVSDTSHGCDHITSEGTGLAVRTVCGDDYVATSPWGDPSVIKVDIEGHEPEFLQGCARMLRRARPVLMMEVNPTTWHTSEMRSAFGAAVDELFDIYGAALWIHAAGNAIIRGLDIAAQHDEATTLLFDPHLPVPEAASS